MKNHKPIMTRMCIIGNDAGAKEEQISIIWQVASMMDFQSTHPYKLIASKTAWARKTMMIRKSLNREKSLTCLHFINTGKISKAAWTIASLDLRARDQDATHLFTVLVARKVKPAMACMDTHLPWVSAAQKNVEVTSTYQQI